MRQRYSAEQWSRWFVEQRESGLSIADFCDSIGVSPNSFYRWRKKAAVDVAATGPSDRMNSSLTQSFVPLSITSSAVSGSAAVEIDLPCGAIVRVARDESLMRQVFGVLLELEAANTGGSSC